MRKRQLFAVCWIVGAIALAAGTATAAESDFFDKEVRPILVQKCVKCHGAGEKLEGNLSLLTRDGILKGGDSGPAVVVGKPDESLLIEAVNFDGFEMPPTGKIAPKQIATLTRWVREGMAWGKDAQIVDPDELASKTHTPPTVNEETKKFWSHRPIRRPEVPHVKDKSWVKTPIDAFVQHGLEEAELAPAGPAAKEALVRRAYYNLTGLPPSPEDVQEFLADESPDAWSRLIDELLASPQYGEHWGRHWLDLVRYAETNSYERDGAKPSVWRYRDYVIRAFNDDKPYDEFIRQQLAGDERKSATKEDYIATGYYRLGIWDDEPADRELALYDDLDDIQLITSQVLLGITMNCARCHDHKLDPISQKDYYSMLSFMAGVKRFGVRSGDTIKQNSIREIGTPEQKARQATAIAEHQKKQQANRKAIVAIEKIVKQDFIPVEHEEFKHEMNRIPLVKKRVGKVITQKQFDEYQTLKQRQKDLQRFRPPALDEALVVKEVGATPREMFVLGRGNPQSKGDKVEPAFPEIFGFDAPTIPPAKPDAPTSGRRTVLADWIAGEKNPRTARVMVNRIWQYHFGRGIVPTPNEFGMQGQPPTHPELLDWLADEFMAGGWKLKRIHKLIMESSVYQMSSRMNEQAYAADPGNERLWRYNMRRLNAEEIRDSILAVNGALNRESMFGPSIYTIIPQEVLAGQSRPGAGWGNSPPEQRNRRSIYIHVKRSLITPFLKAFDAADADATCPERFSTAQPTQSLEMVNGDFINREASVLADYLKKQAGNDQSTQVKTALWRVLQREPTDLEIERGVELINKLKAEYGADDELALQSFCVVALNLNEFLYLD